MTEIEALQQIITFNSELLQNLESYVSFVAGLISALIVAQTWKA